MRHSTTFFSEMKKLVCSVNLEPAVFESKWNEMMVEYGLVGDSWFQEMYRIRSSWIPAFFKDLPMSGLMQTTSRSESVNAFFNVYHAYWSDLRSFLTSFDNAIEEQRARHADEEVKTKTTLPRKVSPSPMEEHTAMVYTRRVSLIFKKNCLWPLGTVVGMEYVRLKAEKFSQ